MLLNPRRREQEATEEKAEKPRISGGGFTGLVRHVMELSAEGEMPLALDDGTLDGDEVDEPMGCAVEYTLPTCEVMACSVFDYGDGRKRRPVVQYSRNRAVGALFCFHSCLISWSTHGDVIAADMILRCHGNRLIRYHIIPIDDERGK